MAAPPNPSIRRKRNCRWAAARAQAKGLDADIVRSLYALLIGYSCNLEGIIKDELSRDKVVGE